MKIAVIGLGSMGKRRIRCLQKLGVKEIIAFDIRSDRRNEAAQLGVKIHETFDKELINSSNAVIISTPPAHHKEYMAIATELRKPYFVEAGVLRESLDTLHSAANHAGILAAPSCTLRFHPAVKIIKQLVSTGNLGTITHFTYHCGQNLNDWHSFEKIDEFYVSDPTTGGAKEMLPFELNWLSDTFGPITEVFVRPCNTATLERASQVIDLFSVSIVCGSVIGTVTIDVLSHVPTREIRIFGTKNVLYWNWDDSYVKVYDGEQRRWSQQDYSRGEANSKYNSNICEEMYIQEISEFLNCLKDNKPFCHTLDQELFYLKTLEIDANNGNVHL